MNLTPIAVSTTRSIMLEILTLCIIISVIQILLAGECISRFLICRPSVYMANFLLDNPTVNDLS